MKAKVAIISRTKNRPLLLPRCIESVLNQRWQDWVHVIINDGGDPAAVESVASRFAGRYRGRLKIIHNAISVGMQNASNQAIRASESDYLVIHDDDDTWHELFLQECVSHLEASGPQSTEQGVATQSWWIMEELDSWGGVVEISREDFMPFESVSLFQMAGKNRFPPIAFLYRRAAHEKVGWFDQRFNELGDYDFNLRFLSQYDIGTIHKKLAGYHWRHQTGGSSYGNTVTERLPAHRQALVKIQNHYLRQDLADQKMGLGFLLGVAANFDQHGVRLDTLQGRSDRVLSALNKTVKKLEHYERLAESWLSPWKNKTLPRRVFDQVSEMVSPTANGVIAQNGAANGALEESIRKASVVSLDVFDTALLRLVRKPTDVFLYMQSEARRLLNRPGLGFVEARVAAEHESRQETRRLRASDETTLDEIYAVLRKRLDCEEATAEQIKQLELKTENELCYANPQIAKLVGTALNGSRRLVFSSDMYLPAGEITGLLERNGFKAAPLFLSSELCVSKHEGGLFDRVVSTLNCRPDEVLHIGDNPHSDVARPVGRGIAAHHWTRPPSEIPLVDQHTSYSGAWEGDLASSLYAGLARRRRLEHPVTHAGDRAFWEMIGYEVMGPLHHAYLSWLIERAYKQGLKKLFFLSRDGYQLLKGFELFRQQNGVEIKTEYLFASRRLWNLARVTALDEESLAFLVTPHVCMRVRDFLDRIGINPAPHEALVRRLGFKGLDERVTTRHSVFVSEEQHQAMRSLMREFNAEILERAARERNILAQYFEEVGLLEDNVGIVDLGWQASSAKSLQALLAVTGHPRKIPAFYFGTWNYASAAVDAGCHLESLFVHVGQPAYRSSILLESVELIESFFSAPHPTIVGIEKRDGKWIPVHGAAEVDASTSAALEIATATSLQFVRDALAIWPKTQELAPAFGYLETTLERLLRHPRKDEAAAFGKFSWRNTFGGNGPLRRLAAVPSSWQRIARREALQEAYDECYWKKGFVAQLTPAARQHLRP